MKAILCKSFGTPDNLVLEEVQDLKPKEGEALVEVYAAALNFPDTLQIAGKYQYQPPFPFIPGSEAAGVIMELGPNIKGFEIGDRVMAIPGVGAMAEQVCVPASGLRKIPESMSFKTASGFPMVYSTSYYALKQRANLQPGETLLVLGASGGVGVTAVELGKLMGAQVIAGASSEEKLQFAKKAGADFLINYSDGDLKTKIKELTKGKGADVIYDPVGGDLFDQATRCINWNGRLLVVGFTSGRIPEYKANLALLKGASMVGVFLGRFATEEPEAYEANMVELFEFFKQGKIKPAVYRSFKMDDFVSAFNVFKERKVMGKVTLEFKK
ncbi:MAG: NADPH:quinone oxidoreductase family protein [SAR324 cluster bacterium]|nr:NADPH:quinone oxidoreductase family protein [SAR324 cluster bacterium]